MQETKIERRRRLDRENYHRRKADPNYRKAKADSTTKYTSKDKINGSSKFVGVSWNKRAKKWMSSIRIKGKLKYLGYFDDEVEASNAYQKELEKL